MSSNFQELIDKSVEESRLQIANTAGHLAVAHQSFANDYLLNVANQALYMLGISLSIENFEVELEGLRVHLLDALKKVKAESKEG
ncbi:TPA: hypothetical protein U2K51_002865 [Acinetobacter nosocomialis]|uniref:hypothetical protein n=1 Tax=Acinetobacter nosocomialis TaxID=106654 RepID=UPI0021CD82BD|nr:hypothetical protein [Acinetobacter nosocomialis]MCU4453201.1 hypothetical protein [Acinetobacter nosocomialis]HEM7141770.1 hypothetical protein [Acinetobacter nosocomialis]